jgi:uncharacterized protein YdaU (DUF1376 family)
VKLFSLPLHINEFLGSAFVQEMDDAQFRWYFRMIGYAWGYSVPCCLPNEDEKLRIYAGATKAQWDKKKQLVLDRFEITEDGKYLTNKALLEKYQKVLADHERRQNAGRSGGLAKASNATATPSNKNKSNSQSQIQEVQKPLASPEAPPAKVIGRLPLNDGSEFSITEPFAKQMAGLYPATDVIQEFRNMKGWLIANEKKRKTKNGIKNFITTWLSKEQDKGGRNGQAGKTKLEVVTDRNDAAFRSVIGDLAGDGEEVPQGTDRS